MSREEFHGISLHVTITVAPENAEKFLDAFKTCFDLVTKEPQCTFFEVFRDPETPGRFKWVENWSKGREWFFEVWLFFSDFVVAYAGIGACG